MKLRPTHMGVWRLWLVLLLATAPACGDGTNQADKDGSTSDVASDSGADDTGNDVGGGVDSLTADSADADTLTQSDGDAAADAASDVLADISTSDTGGLCPGGAGCTCSQGDQCTSGVCLMGAAGAKVCYATCAEGGVCGDGTHCLTLPGAADAVCVPFGLTDNAPCTDTAVCAAGTFNGVCASYGAVGSFCRPTCTEAKDCAENEDCADGQDEAGQAIKFCQVDMQAPPCSAFAAAVGASTACYEPGFPGCTTSRKCGLTEAGAAVLAECAPPAAVTEVCNGADDDCDGDTDNAVSCDDGNPCTQDACKGAAGCANLPDTGTACDDNDACTKEDACAVGLCAGVTVTCDDANPCTDDACETGAGCVATANGAACDDGDACTSDDTCANAACTGAAVKCDDGNVCTDDACDPKAGCTSANNGASCNDANACTEDDVCDAGTCKGTEPGCDDANFCTDDTCDPKEGCIQTPNTAPCNDGSVCTKGDKCAVGLCAGVTVDCDDSDPCTDDSCDPTSGCASTPNTAPCNDNNACTAGDVCALGLCAGVTAVVCDDGDVCTDDACDLAKGCTATHNNAPCDDGNACTAGDACAVGLCVSGTATNCDDGNTCTDDACDMASGCTTTHNSAPCDDGNACTAADGCALGMCAGATEVNCDDGNGCTLDACDPAAGCTATVFEGACDDGNACTTNESCDATGACQGATPVDCEDGNACTDDPCDPTAGCAAKVFTTQPCDDGAPCTVGDKCDGEGQCKAGPAMCGGDCAKCANGEVCVNNQDCQSDNCVEGKCLIKLVFKPNVLLINEVDYDQPGTDGAEFLEIYNPGPDAADLSKWKLEHVNGSNNSVVWTIDLVQAGQQLPAGGYLVVGVQSVIDALPQATLKLDRAANFLQNGDPDGLRLLLDGQFADGLAWGGGMEGVSEGSSEGKDSGSAEGSLSRCPNGMDVGDNDKDFAFTGKVTPGAANVCP